MMAIEGGEENPAVIEPASKVGNQSSLQPHLNLSHITSMATMAAALIPRRHAR